MDELLSFFKEVLPEESFVPSSFCEAKKFLHDLGLGYTKIDACQNDCILYWRDYANDQLCPKCGPKSLGNDTDVYLQPMIEELKEFWNRVEIYDAHLKSNFLMRAALMLTINDYPTYGDLSGWSTKGKLACPC
ncbi:hypothetical protein RDI58_017711 [Solanum bulbocastanum]|uniref:Transposase-associated domain-containing protein n=1 Tax=Solanum bulbocastanum TaxID=147425 RepID=A0AAN8Y9G1_SOLBU